ncbi:VOC family protein [Sphingobium sp. TKS]|uniref:VOC family protein n=1 Tax=Sphingobium sp. TKS TaxID=1315974 RepID=UPI00076FEA4A|nr:VOC family protein [Sphingobium sp. TKS]AMK26529.1 BphC-like dioxygenase [Sphingobium sp. TKS]
MNHSENALDQSPVERPAYFAHFVVRTSQYAEMVRWYSIFLNADLVYNDEKLTFLTFDEEHHRLAIVNKPGLVPMTNEHAGIDHVAYSYSSFEGLFRQYEWLKKHDILPHISINHGPTTSLYYKDPDGNQVENQVNNWPDAARPKAYFKTEAFAQNPLGEFFDPDAMSAKILAGSDVTAA